MGENPVQVAEVTQNCHTKRSEEYQGYGFE